MIRIPHDAWVLVGDGRKALVLRNEGDELYPNLKVEQVFRSQPNPPTREQGTDRPGRAMMGSSRRSAMDQTDWHVISEQLFAREVAEAMTEAYQAGQLKALAVVAPPRTLAELREALGEQIRAIIFAEVDKDLTKHPVHEIERLLTAAK